MLNSKTDSLRQIIIGGVPRSGTSMIKAIIGSHSEVAAYIWEFPFWNDYYAIFKDKNLNRKKINRIVDGILDSEALKRSDVHINHLEFKKCFRHSRRYQVQEIYDVFAKLYLNGREKNILAIKNPYIELFAHEIIHNFPNSKFVYILRNPLDNFVSLKKAGEKWWNMQFNELYHIYNWKKSYKKSKMDQLKYNANYYVIKYEDIINTPNKSLFKLCDFLELDFEEEMLQMKDQPGWSGSNSSIHPNINSNLLYNKSIGTYEKFLSKKTIDVYLQLLGQELNESNYTLRITNQTSDRLLQLKFYLLSSVLDIQSHIKMMLKRTKIYNIYKYIMKK